MGLEHPEITKVNRTGYTSQDWQRKKDSLAKSPDKNYIKPIISGNGGRNQMAKDIYEMTVREIVETGAKIQVNYYNIVAKNESEALEQLKGFNEINAIVKDERNGTNWVQMEDDDVTVTAFHEVDKDE